MPCRAVLAICEDAARHRYSDDHILRRLRQAAHLPSVPTALRALYGEPARDGTGEAAGQEDEMLAHIEGTGAACNRLAPVLSMLTRASQMTL
ncbi:hypothetical protein ACWEQN_35210 [Streptomyces sp. NPDC004129]